MFPTEPKSRGDAFESPLRGLPNVILTPHVGGSTEEAQEDIGRFVGGKLRDYVHSGSTSLSVNLPTLTPGRVRRTRSGSRTSTRTPRACWPHVNQVLAEHDVNIGGQVLATRGHTGYVVTDTGSGLSEDVLASLHAVPETVRLRVID